MPNPVSTTTTVCRYTFPLDHFGVVASPLVNQLLNQDSDKRKRRTALRSLVRMAKVTHQLPSEETILSVGLSTDTNGQIWLVFDTVKEESTNELPTPPAPV